MGNFNQNQKQFKNEHFWSFPAGFILQSPKFKFYESFPLCSIRGNSQFENPKPNSYILNPDSSPKISNPIHSPSSSLFHSPNPHSKLHSKMDSLHGLPPLKRLRILQEQELNRQKEDQSLHSCSLPAKKRKESRDSSLSLVPDTTLPHQIAISSSAYCLPTKKRVWALHPDFAAESLDLNIEYKPPLEEESISKAELGSEVKEKEEDKEREVSDTEIEIQATERIQDEEEDDGILCAICQSTDGDPSDPIVFCDGCDLMVHASCYGNPLVKSVPEGDWFCAQCLAASSSKTDEKKVLEIPFSCCLCPLKGGAVKPTNDGRWAHIVCGLYVPEVFFEDPDGREGIDCSKILKRRWKSKCYICKTSRGCAIDCSEPKCNLAFHVTCGLKEDLCIEYQEGRRSGAIVAGFCRNHTDLWKKQQLTGKFKIVARDEGKL